MESLEEINIPVTVVPTAVVTDAPPKSNANRVGKCGRRKRTADVVPTTNKRQVPNRGAASHLLYERGCKVEATAASMIVRDAGASINVASLQMQQRLMSK